MYIYRYILIFPRSIAFAHTHPCLPCLACQPAHCCWWCCCCCFQLKIHALNTHTHASGEKSQWVSTLIGLVRTTRCVCNSNGVTQLAHYACVSNTLCVSFSHSFSLLLFMRTPECDCECECVCMCIWVCTCAWRPIFNFLLMGKSIRTFFGRMCLSVFVLYANSKQSIIVNYHAYSIISHIKNSMAFYRIWCVLFSFRFYPILSSALSLLRSLCLSISPSLFIPLVHSLSVSSLLLLSHWIKIIASNRAE